MSEQKRMDPIHPREILLEDFMKPLRFSIHQLARDLDVPRKPDQRDRERQSFGHG